MSSRFFNVLRKLSHVNRPLGPHVSDHTLITTISYKLFVEISPNLKMSWFIFIHIHIRLLR